MKNLLSQFSKSNTFNKIWLILVVLSAGMLTLYFVNNTADNQKQQSTGDYEDKPDCKVTDPALQLYSDNSDLQTVFQIASIDIDQELSQTQLSKNGIPALVSSKHMDFSEADKCLNPEDEVLVVQKDDQVKLFPRKILNYHLVINDQIAGIPLLITRCNLCDSYAVYVREFKNEELLFGVSGLLFKNNDLLFDHKTESLWSQFDGKARVGTYVDAELAKFPYEVLTYKHAKNKYPDANVHSFDTGFARNYQLDPFAEFYDSSEIIGPITNSNNLLAEKTPIFGLYLNGQHYAFLTSKRIVQLDDAVIRIEADGLRHYAVYKDDIYELSKTLWYVWFDFYPDTKLLE